MTEIDFILLSIGAGAVVDAFWGAIDTFRKGCHLRLIRRYLNHLLFHPSALQFYPGHDPAGIFFYLFSIMTS